MKPETAPIHTIRKSVFWPSYLAFFIIGGMSFLGGAPFIATLEKGKSFMFNKLDWLFAYGTLTMVIIAVIVYFSPMAKVKIGGKDATPLLNKKQWFAISLCTTVAAGIMFWATSEPLMHLHAPPITKGIEALSPLAERFALATLFHHWTITPYAIYTIPGLAFALAFYNLKQPFSLAAIFSPILGASTQKYASLIDGICVFALVAGMASSLGTGALTLSGAFLNYFPKSISPLLLALIIALLVISFTASAASGLMKGIRILSNLNFKMFLVMVALMFALGPSKYIATSAIDGLKYFFSNFISMSTFTTSASGDPWPNEWPIFYWSSWLSWAPITAVFLGRISYGHTVRDFIHINLVGQALFSTIWMAVFGGMSLYYERLDGSLYDALKALGPNSVTYELLKHLPIASILIVLFIAVTFLSYVTSADSTTDAISSLCTHQKSGDLSAEGATRVKVIWAFTIGFVSWVLVAHSGIDGMKLLCCLGGLPALFLVILATIALIKMALVDFRISSTPGLETSSAAGENRVAKTALTHQSNNR